MKIKYNKIKESKIEERNKFNDDKQYVVLNIKHLHGDGLYFGMEMNYQIKTNYQIEDNNLMSMTVHRARYFDQVSETIPSQWIINVVGCDFEILPYDWNSFDFWKEYYDTQNNKRVLYNKGKQKIIFSEFYNSLSYSEKLKVTAEQLDYPWFYCQKCVDAWEDMAVEMLLICSSCGQQYYNPRYNPEEKKLTVKLKESVENSNFSNEQNYSVDSIVVSDNEGAFFAFENLGKQLFSIEQFDVIEPFIPDYWKITYREGVLNLRSRNEN